MTPAQIATLRVTVMAEPTLAQARTTGDDYAIASWLNAAPAVAHYVWRTTTPTDAVCDAVNWTNLTPADVPDGTLLWQNRSIACQGKQFNLQIMVQGQSSLSTGKANIRAGLQDAMTGLPPARSLCSQPARVRRQSRLILAGKALCSPPMPA
jgi:hypothetical protein